MTRDYRYCLHPTEGPWHIRGCSPLEPRREYEHVSETPTLCGELKAGQAVDRFDGITAPTSVRVRGLLEIGAVCEACAKVYLAGVTS